MFKLHDFVMKTLLGMVGNEPDYKVREYALGWYDKSKLTDEDMEVLKGWAEKGSYGGGHADFSEVVSVMGYYPELIATDRLEMDPDMKLGRSKYLADMGVSVVSGWDADHPSTMNGDTPYGASQTIGQAMNTCSAKRLAEIFKVLKEDEECVRIATDPFVKFK